jgi:hypothetical protein
VTIGNISRSQLGAFVRSALGAKGYITADSGIGLIRLFATASGGNYVYSDTLSAWVNLNTILTSYSHNAGSSQRWFLRGRNLSGADVFYSPEITVPTLSETGLFDADEPQISRVRTLASDGDQLFIVFSVESVSLFAAAWRETDDPQWRRLGCNFASGFFPSPSAVSRVDFLSTNHGLYCTAEGQRLVRYNSGIDEWEDMEVIALTEFGRVHAMMYDGVFRVANSEGIYSVVSESLDTTESWSLQLDLTSLALGSSYILPRTLAYDGTDYYFAARLGASGSEIYKNTTLIATVSGGEVKSIVSADGYIVIAGNYTSLTPTSLSAISGSVHKLSSGTFTAFGSIASVTSLFYTNDDLYLSIVPSDATISTSADNVSVSVDSDPPAEEIVVDSVTPATGSTAGGTAVTIAGSGFTADCVVYFGEGMDVELAANIVFVSDTEITCDTPAWPHGAGLVYVAVYDEVTLETGVLIDGFEYT